MMFAFFDDQERLDREAMRRQVEVLCEWGVHGLAILGLATEVNKLSLPERRMLLDWVVEDLAGRVPLAVTIAEPSIPGQIEFARAATDAGAEWIILQPPPVHGLKETDLIRFFATVAATVNRTVGLQLAPEFLGSGLSVDGLNELRRNSPNITHLKLETTPLAINRLVEETHGDFIIFNGRAGLELIDNINAGCSGVIPGAESTDWLVQIYKDLESGSPEGRARAIARERELSGLLMFLFSSLDNFLIYGKALAGRRFGIKNVAPRQPAGQATGFGMSLLDRHSPCW